MTIDRHLGYAFGGSLALHIFGAFIAVSSLVVSSRAPSAQVEPEAPEVEPEFPKEREITMLIPEKIIVEPAPVVKERQFVESTSTQDLDTPPENSKFQSNANAKASSADDPTNPDGDPSKASQQGRDTASVTLENHKALPEAKKPLEETPRIPELTGNTSDESIAPPKEGTEDKKPDEMLAPENSIAAEMKVRSALDGGAKKTTGEAAVDAEGTPRGKYISQVKAAIARQWYSLIEKRGRTAPGILKVRMNVTSDGSLGDIRFIEEDGDAQMKDTALSAILGADVPAMPDEVAGTLKDTPLSFEYEFVSF